ncbi:hypothetical protein RF11_06794 [Thelohanellus kitauei]|uniref:Uncharacterized protein n=1 Tax=Thelohanellus kitauei TaxID=669202 RepID=A0A0C2ISC5_THEKT|nr:hypothetical protein RF11_06794 [Thelohanellus kitauei]
MRNYNTLMNYFTDEFSHINDSISKYCWKRFRNLQFRMFMAAINDIMENLHQCENTFNEDICGTFKTSSADCEGWFNLMNSIKTKLRIRLQLNNLDSLMCITFYISSGNIINLDAI